MQLTAGEFGTVAGWGRLSEGGVLPSILQHVSVPIVSNQQCKNMFLAAGRHEVRHGLATHSDGSREFARPLKTKLNNYNYNITTC